jgi:hypothetical protein
LYWSWRVWPSIPAGVREDTALQTIADAMAPDLTERGLQIAGRANHFRTRFRVHSQEDAEAIGDAVVAIEGGQNLGEMFQVD